MDIGQALAAARSQAGLTVEDVSERTRIRRTIISDIERDDYSACGGDFYARGHIRAIAKVVGTDPVPLIERYDELTALGAAEAATGQGGAELVTGPDPKTWWREARHSDSAAWRHVAFGPGPETRPQPPVLPGRASPSKQRAAGEPKTQPQPVVETQPQSATEAQPQPATEAQPQSAVDPQQAIEAQPEPAALTQPRPATEAQPQGAAEPQRQAEMEAQPTAELSAGRYPGPSASQAGSTVSPADLAALRRTAARGAAAARRSALAETTGARAAAAARALSDAAAQVRKAAAEAADRAATRLADQRATGSGSADAASPAGEPGGPPAAARLRQAGASAVQRVLHARTAGRRLSLAIGGLAIVLAVLVLVIYALAASPAHSASRPPARHRVAAGKPASSGRPSPAASTPGPASSAVAVTPVSAVAFGPGGASQGDNPQQAQLALSGSGVQGWNTNWYTTPDFGGLQSGTGLLLDLGRPVSVSSVTMRLGSAGGGALELRAGNTPALADLPAVMTVADTAGTVTISLRQPVTARYLLVWFIRLPPDSSGTYQATIYHVSVTAAG